MSISWSLCVALASEILHVDIETQFKLCRKLYAAMSFLGSISIPLVVFKGS